MGCVDSVTRLQILMPLSCSISYNDNNTDNLKTKQSPLENLLSSLMLEKALRSSEKPVSPLHLHGEDAVPDPVSFPSCQEGGVAAEAQRQHELLGGASSLMTSLTSISISLCS